MDLPRGLLGLTNGLEFSRNAVLNRYATLRRLCVRYRDAGGKGWIGNGTVPELDGSVEEGQMCRMRTFDNIVGHPVKGRMVAYPYEDFSGASTMLSALLSMLSSAMDSRMLWCPPLATEYVKMDGEWVYDGKVVPEIGRSILEAMEELGIAPISGYSCHAFYEAQRIQEHSPLRELFTYDSQVTPVTGLLGTFHNNTAVDVVVDEDPDVPDFHERRFKDEYLGILCTGHTAHSQDAGVARRVTVGIDVRLLCRSTLAALKSLIGGLEDDEDGTWTLFCMGYSCPLGAGAAREIWARSEAARRVDMPLVSVYFAEHKELIVLSISSGTLVKRLEGRGHYDSCELHADVWPRDSPPPAIDEEEEMKLMDCMSAFFHTIPYVDSDRPPRPLMASVQTQQAVCTPWSPGTAAVAPCYISRPLIRTPLISEVLDASEDNEHGIADEMPGFDVCICFANLAENYEDAMVVSKRFAELGGFSTMSVCHYLLPLGEYVPPPGFPLCSRVSRWWKSTCPSHCKHVRPKEGDAPRRTVSVDRNPTGTVLSSRITAAGEIAVDILSFSVIQVGDKISSGHGQKGVSNILPAEDMPYGVTASGETINFDVVMAISSVINRQTNGQVYEATAGVKAARGGKCVVHDGSKPDIEEEVTLYDGTTGERSIVVLEGRRVRVASATFGFTRMLNQTQMVRERHHATHFVPGPHSVAAPTGRSRGGPVKIGEMEVQAMISIGLVSCARELMARGNMVTCDVCTSCKRLCVLCECDGESEGVSVMMPYGTVVFDVTTAATEGHALEYELAPGS
ncbi:hypothetical protein BBP40_010724 [Aspergillus hancockii]|nr:hypothetical protein BBP40_010724 [Aspergillus hancockii]